MKYTCTVPDPRLTEYVRFYWTLESEDPYVHRAMADSCAEIVFHFKGRFTNLDSAIHEVSSLATIRGISSTYSRFSCNEPFGIFGVYLYPSAMPGLFRVPGLAISNDEVGLDEVLGAVSNAIETDIREAVSHEARVAVMNTFLIQQLIKLQSSLHDPIDWVLKQLIHQPAGLPIEELAAKCFLSRRQFDRKFKETSGLNPGLYASIIRFQSAAAHYGTSKSLTEIAYECGYYDQSHFIRDFKRFSGYTPSQYFKGHAEGTAWRES